MIFEDLVDDSIHTSSQSDNNILTPRDLLLDNSGSFGLPILNHNRGFVANLGLVLAPDIGDGDIHVEGVSRPVNVADEEADVT
jgi:hypothetical protein